MADAIEVAELEGGLVAAEVQADGESLLAGEEEAASAAAELVQDVGEALKEQLSQPVEESLEEASTTLPWTLLDDFSETLASRDLQVLLALGILALLLLVAILIAWRCLGEQIGDLYASQNSGRADGSTSMRRARAVAMPSLHLGSSKQD
uniref:Uncharacterized protein n=1 Tax=Pinguiococcus pyrenoidosus TaxID=172671 RepID=A0A7R9UE91_9STRA